MPHSFLIYGLLSVLAIALLAAAVTDLKSRTIANGLNAGIALAAPLFWWATGLEPWPGMAIQLGLAAFVFAVAAGLFAIGQMGGGDVKLLGALALWFPPQAFVGLVVIMALLGYALTMVFGALGMVRGKAAPRAEITRLALFSAAAALLALSLAGVGLVPVPEALRTAAQSSAVMQMLVLQLPIAALAVVSIALIRLFRRNGVAVETPYGVAIAAAGLWTLAMQVQAPAAIAAALAA